MATCSTDTLLAADPCYAALSPFMQQVVLTQMLCNLRDKLLNGGSVTCDVQTLIEQGACFAAMPPFILSTLQLSLLCDISDAL